MWTCHYIGEYRGDAYSIWNLKYSVAKEIPIVFHNESDYDYHFIIKWLVEEFEGQSTSLEGNTKKYVTFSVPVEKEVTRIDKNGKKLQKLYLKDYNLFTAQDLWEVHYQILSIIFMKLFIKWNVNTDTMIKNGKLQ